MIQKKQKIFNDLCEEEKKGTPNIAIKNSKATIQTEIKKIKESIEEKRAALDATTDALKEESINMDIFQVIIIHFTLFLFLIYSILIVTLSFFLAIFSEKKLNILNDCHMFL